MKARGTCIDWERNIIIYASSLEVSQIFLHFTLCPLKENSLEVSQIVPHFALKAIEREVMSPCIYQVWWALLHCHEHKENVFIFRTSTVKSSMLVLYNQSKKKVCQPTYPIFFYKNVTVTQAFFPWLNLKTWIFRRKMICQSFWHYSQFPIPLDYNYQ